jgi:hypothetical protein
MIDTFLWQQKRNFMSHYLHKFEKKMTKTKVKTTDHVCQRPATSQQKKTSNKIVDYYNYGTKLNFNELIIVSCDTNKYSEKHFDVRV